MKIYYFIFLNLLISNGLARQWEKIFNELAMKIQSNDIFDASL